MTKYYELHASRTNYDSGFHHVTLTVFLADVCKADCSRAMLNHDDQLTIKFQGNGSDDWELTDTYYAPHLIPESIHVEYLAKVLSVLRKLGQGDHTDLSCWLKALHDNGYQPCAYHRWASQYFPVNKYPTQMYWSADNQQINAGTFADSATEALPLLVKEFARKITVDKEYGNYAVKGLQEWMEAGKPVTHHEAESLPTVPHIEEKELALA